MHDFNASIDKPSQTSNCSQPEVNTTSGTLTSWDGKNCTLPSSAAGGAYTATGLLADRRYDIAVVCCIIVATSVCLNALMVSGLVRRGGRQPVGVARSSLLLNLVAGDWIMAGGGCGMLERCGMLVVTLVEGRWPFGDVGCRLYTLSTLLSHVISYYTLASFIIER